MSRDRGFHTGAVCVKKLDADVKILTSMSNKTRDPMEGVRKVTVHTGRQPS